MKSGNHRPLPYSARSQSRLGDQVLTAPHLGARFPIRKAGWIVGCPVVLIAGLLRLVDLGSVPPGLFIDEVWSSLGPQLFHGSASPFHWPLSIAVAQFSSAQLFFSGLSRGSVFWTRFPAALLGIAAIPLMYWLVTHWFSRQTALLAALAMALSPWAIQLSRYAVPGIALVVWTIAFVLCFEKLLARPRTGWLAGATLSAIALLGSHAVANIFLPLLGVGYLLLRRREVFSAFWTLFWQSIVAVGLVTGYLLMQILPILHEQGQFKVQASLISNLAFAKHSAISTILWGIVVRYFEHWNPSFLFLHGDPNIKYSIGVGGELFILGPFVYVGLFLGWTHRNVAPWRTVLWWALVWPLPSALVVPDNPNAVRTAPGLPVLIILGVIGFEWAVDRTLGALRARWFSSGARDFGSSAVLVLGFAFTIFIYFVGWPSKPGVAKAFEYGYKQLANSLEERHEARVVVSGDVWRADDLLRFYGLAWPDVFSIAPGMPLYFDLFRSHPGYLITSNQDEARQLGSWGYGVRLLEVVRTPIGQPNLWLYRVDIERESLTLPLSSLAFSSPSRLYRPVVWDPKRGRLQITSARISDQGPAVGYATCPRPFFGAMQLTYTIRPQHGLSESVFAGFTSYRDPALGSPDGVSPFMGVFFRLVTKHSGWLLIAEDRSVDSREVSKRVLRGRGPTTLRVSYDYLDGFRSTFEVQQSGKWRTLLKLSNYVKQPLFPFVGLISDRPSEFSARILDVSASSGSHVRVG
jgi:4-amino-4-deoxy-L-arabinose transferase-like glycosyltransferase